MDIAVASVQVREEELGGCEIFVALLKLIIERERLLLFIVAAL